MKNDMKAIILDKGSKPFSLVFTNLPVPEVQQGEVLIKVKAIGINPVDVKTREGESAYKWLAVEDPLILGRDISGVIAESGDPDFRVGDEVFGMINFPGHGQCYAEFVSAPVAHLTHKPKNVTHEQAAATTLAALTAYQSLGHLAGLKAGENVLIHAAAGGVGHFAVQIARHVGAYVTGTSSARNKDFVLDLGCNEFIDYKSYDWNKADKVYDVILDTIGGVNIDHSLSVIKSGGRLIAIPTCSSEGVVEKSKAMGVEGYTFRVSSNGLDMKVLGKFLEAGIISPYLSEVFEFAEMDKAHEQLKSGRTKGKVVVRLE